MTDNEWHYFCAGMFWTVLVCGGFMAIVIGCSAQAQPTPCDRQLTNCRSEVATWRAALEECQKK